MRSVGLIEGRSAKRRYRAHARDPRRIKRMQTYYNSNAKRIQKYIAIKFTDRLLGSLGEIIIIGLTLLFFVLPLSSVLSEVRRIEVLADYEYDSCRDRTEAYDLGFLPRIIGGGGRRERVEIAPTIV